MQIGFCSQQARDHLYLKSQIIELDIYIPKWNIHCVRKIPN